MESMVRFDDIDDLRSGPLRRAVAALADESVVAGRLDSLEAARRDLSQDHTPFDDRDGAVTVSEFSHRVSKPPEWCRFLHVLAHELAPRTVVEMGTGVGISAAAIASALPPASLMWTVDLRPESGEYARRLFNRLGLSPFVVTGRFDEILDQVLFEAEPVDLLFVDGHHQYQPTLDYTDQAAAYLSDRAVVVYDDISWSEGMQQAWAEIRTQDRWAWTVDLGAVGVCGVRS